jgi:hypothetical protein
MMAGPPFAVMALLAMLMGGGSRDLLDLMSSEQYWKAKNVTVSVETLKGELAETPAGDISALIKGLGANDFEQREAAQKKIEAMGPAVTPQLKEAAKSADPETATRAKAIMDTFASGSRAGQVRRLMALRTLGELKKPEALPILTPLLASKRLFEADYAAAAIAAIEGKPYSRPRATATVRAGDVNLMPGNLGVVGQMAMTGATGTTLNLDKVFEQLAPMAGQTKEQMSAQAFEQILKIADMVGNFRFDGATFGLADDVGNEKGFEVTIARGLYDREALLSYIKTEAGDSAKVREEKGVQVIVLDSGDQATLILPSNELLIFTVGARGHAPVDELLAAVAAGKGGMAANMALVGIIKTIDTSNPVWAAMKVNDSYRQAPPLAPFDSMTLVVETKGGNLDFKISATGSDKEKTSAAVKMVNDGVQMGLMQFQAMTQQMPNMAGMFKDLIDTMQSIKATADGGNATLTGTVKSSVGAGMTMPAMMFGMPSVETVPQPMPPNAAPAAPVQQAPATAPAKR